tara:strand:- start:312 stop:683 length:372 start_codon:yes stop_codon:yes gene_type:complete
MSPEKLIEYAYIAQKRAKATYSNYKVGAALHVKNDIIVLGCNVESKAYPTTLCAERVAIFSALAQGHESFMAIALVTSDGAFPCGSCRQILYEYAKDISIYVSNESSNYKKYSITELLPYPFG